MKKLILSSLVILLVASAASAQIRFGVKAGANLNKLSGQAFKEGYDLGYHLGAFSEIELGKSLGIQPEVLFNQVNTERASGTDPVLNNWQNNTSNIKLNYLSIPILLRYNVNNLLNA